MKSRIYFSSLFLSLLLMASAHAATVNLDAGELTSPVSAPMMVDNTFPSTNGSLLLLIDLGVGNVLSDTLTAGNYVSGANSILAVGGFNNNGGTNETLTTFTLSLASETGHYIALRWFPQISLDDYNLGRLPSEGDYFGTYSPAGGNPDGGDFWTVPASGTIDLFFFATGDAGYADLQVIPEPATYGLLGLSLVMALLYRSFRRNAAKPV